MKPKKKRVTEVPPSIRSFIDGVAASPLEDIELMLRDFVWEYDKGDFNHWTELFNLFDSYLDKYIGPRKDLSLEDGFLEADMPFPRGPVLQILRISRLISEHCSNRHLVSSFERHLSSLLSSTDADIIEASLQTLMAFTNKSISKSLSVRTGSLASKLFTLSQGWGGKDGALGLVACSLPDHLPSEAGQLGSTLHFEFYSTNHGSKGLRVIHMPDVNLYRGSDLELLAELIKEHDVPVEMRFSLLTRLRFARAFGSLAERCRFVCIRLYAFVMLVHVGREHEDVETLLGNEPEFIDELLSLLNYDEIPEKIRVLAILSLAALCQDRSHTPTAIYSVTSGAHSSVLPGLLQKTIDSITNGSTKCSVIFAEALLSLVLVLVSSTPGSLALQESGLISTILPLLKDTNPQHLLLVTTAVQVVEGLLDYHNPSSAVFRDLGGLDDSILRLKSEISVIESVSVSRTAEQEPSTSQESSRKGKEPETALIQVQAAHSDSLFLHNRRALIKALLRTISLATYVPGATARVGGSEENVLPHCLCAIFKRGKEFGGGVFSLGAHVMMDLIHKDPTCFPALEAAGLPGAFIDVITNGPLCSSDAVTCIPPCLEALCLNGNGLQMVKERNALRCFLRIFTSKSYLKALNGEAAGVISNGLDELLRHAPTLRPYGVDAVIWILDSLAKIGSGSGSSSGSGSESPSTVVPMDIDKPVEKDQMGNASITVESFLPGCISNIVRLLEPIVQNSDTCRMFVEKKGVEKVLQLFDLECIPVSLSIGNSISSAFKNFSPTQSVAMLRIVGSFIREQLKSVNGVLSSAVSGSKLDESEPAKQMEVLRSLSGLEGLLVLSSFLLKNNTVMMAELAVAEAEILKELAKIYVETTWQLSLLAESKPDEDFNGLGQEPGTCRDDSIAIVSEREIGGEASTEPASSTVHSDGISASSSSMEAPLYNWNADEALASMVRSAASMHRNGHRHGRLSSLARLRGGARLTRHLEALHAHSDTEGPVFTLENYISLHTGDNKSPDCHVREVLTRLAAAIRAFLLMVVKSLPGRRRTEPTLNPASRSVLTALSRLFHTALGYSGHSTPGFESSLSVKCCYLGKVSDDMSALTFDSWRRACNTSVVNGFYVTGTFKELLTTFEATSQLLWSFPFSTDGKSPNRPSWLLETLQSYCKLLEYYVNSSFLLSPSAPQSTQLLVQPVATELSINLFPVPRDPEGFVSMLQSQVLEAVLPVWNHPVLPTCPATILSPLISIMDHIFSGVGEFKLEHGGSGGVNPRLEIGLSIDETTVSTIVEMGFSRARVEEALRNVGSNSVELATDWLFTHPEELVQEDVQLAQALALSLGSNSEPGKEEPTDRPSGGDDMAGSTVPTPALPLDDVLSVSMKLFQNYSESVALPLGDLLVTLCNRNKGEGRLKVVLYLVQQLKVCPVGPGMDVSLLYPTAHVLALLLAEDGNTREIAAREGLIPVVLGILNFFWSGPRSNDALAEKAISTLLLVLGSMLQQTPIKNAETPEEPNSDGMDKSKEKHVDFLCTVLGKPTGYLTDEESQQALTIACELVKQHVPAVVMQAALQLCARLTKTYSLSTLFLEAGGLSSLFNLPSGSIFPGFDSVASVIVRHVIEDPQTLQSAMELEIKHALSGAGTLARNGSRVSPQSFLTSMAPLICRDPSVFMKAAAAVCQVDSSSGGRLNVVLVKDNKEKDKDRHENKSGDASTPGRLSRVHKRVPPSLSQVMDQLLELIISYEPKAQESSDIYFSEASFDDKIVPMEIDEPNPKGKSKVDDMGESERSACMARVSLVLKLLSEMLLMYSHTALVLLKRDSEMSQMRGNCGILYHILHSLLPLTTKDSKDGSDLLAKLSGRATSFLVALCGRSTEGRRRVVSEIVRAFALLLGGSTGGTSSSTSGPSNGGALVPDRRVWSWCNLVNMILLCNSGSPSSNLSLGCSPDVARAMIDGGMVQSLATVLRALDLDNPHAASICNLILKSLETLTRAANASEPKSDKNKTGGSDHGSVLSIREPGEVHPAADTGTVVAEDQETERDQQLDGQDFATEDTGICMGMSMDRGDSENPHDLARSGLVGEEDVGEDEEEEEEEDEDEEDDDDRDDDMGVAGRGAHLIPLADTNPVDEEEYNDDMIEEDEDDDELIPNRGVIEVRWQGGATGLDQIRLPPEIRVSRGRGFIEIASESFPSDDADDLYNLHSPFGVERRRQPGASAGSNRSALLSRQRSDFVSGFQHPLVARPPRENTSRDNRLHPVSRWRMFDNGMPPDGSLFSGDRLVGSGASSQLLGFSLGMESLRIGGRRGTGFDGRWADNGQPPASSQAAAIAQAIEDHFVSQIQVVTPSGSSNPYPSNSNPGQSGDQVETDPLVNVPILPSASPMLDATLNGGNNAPLSENIPATGEQDDRLMPNELNRDASSDMDSGRSSCHAVIIGTQPVPELSDAHVNSDADASACANSVGIEVPEVSGGANSVEIEASEVNDGYRTPPVPMDSIEGYQTPPVPIEVDVDTNAATAPDDADAEADPPDVNHTENNVDGTNEIDPTFLEALPEDLRAEVLASQQGRQAGGSVGEAETGAGIAGDAADEIDPEFLAALPPDLQAEVLAQQRAQRIAQSHQSSGQPVDMDNASIIATFPPEIREEVLLTSSEAVLSALPSALLAEAQMLRDRELSRYRSRGSLFGGSQHRLGNSGRRFALDNHHHHSVMDRGVGVSMVRRVVPTISSGSRGNSTTKEVEGVPLFDAAALEALIRLFQLAQPLSKGILQRVMLNLCAHSITRRLLIGLIVSMIRPEAEGPGGRTDNVGHRRLYGCQCNVVYAQPQSPTGLPPLVLRQLLEILTFLASSHASVADILSFSDLQSSDVVEKDGEEKGKDVNSDVTETPLMLFLKLLNTPLFLRSRLYIELVMSLLEVVVNNAVSKIDLLPESDNPSESGSPSEIQGMEPPGAEAGTERPFRLDEPNPNPSQPTSAKQSEKLYNILVGLPEPDLRNLCTIMSREGMPDKVYTLAAEVIKKLASVAPCHRKFFSSELATVARSLSSSAVSELSVLRSDQNLGLHSSLAGSAILRVLQSLCTLNSDSYQADEKQHQLVLSDLNSSLEPMWQELSECITVTESKLGQTGDLGPASQPLPPGAQRLLPFIESFFVLCEKLQLDTAFQLENISSSPRTGGTVTFARVAEKHRRLLNLFIRQNPSLLEKSLSMMLKVPRLIDFDNKRAYFRSRIRQQHDNLVAGPIRISVRRAYVLEDSYNQLRLRRYQDLKGRLTVQFQGEEGIDAGGLTREWYQLLSRVIFDKGALLFTTVGNNASFQPNPNSVYQTEHLSYFKFVGRVVAKALFDGQLLDVHFTRSFYKHMLGVKVTYHDIEAVDPDYYKNLKWMLENDVNDIPDLTFSMDADEEKHILYEKNQVTDYELKPGGRNIKVTEETKHEYVDLVADHILTNAIRPQINAFLEGFTELIPRELISIFNDKELELLISGLPEIDLNDLKANSEYIGYSAASPVIQWFWEVVKGFNKEDRARLLQFVTGTSKVPLEGFKALQGISGPQRFQIHKAYGAPDRLPSAHTCFNQLDLPEYNSKEQLEERLLLAIHEASEGFGFG
ncbi:E3 ubiquitin-protein ligase UPL1-like [Carex rostrata]